jgi:hypothetical protein
MARSYATVPAHARPRAKTPVERAEEAHALQLRLKQEAAERRRQAERDSSAKRPSR